MLRTISANFVHSSNHIDIALITTYLLLRYAYMFSFSFYEGYQYPQIHIIILTGLIELELKNYARQYNIGN